MRQRSDTSKIVDEILRYGVGTLAIGGALVIPGLAVALSKPLDMFFKDLDEKDRQREITRIVYYMKEQGLLAGNYEHGLQITDKARRRLIKSDFNNLHVTPQEKWDGKWRIVIYDIPESHKQSRQRLTKTLHSLGCFQLQKSTWISPFPCRNEIEIIATHYDIDSFVTYFEAIELDNANPLLRRFQRKYPKTMFQSL